MPFLIGVCMLIHKYGAHLGVKVHYIVHFDGSVTTVNANDSVYFFFLGCEPYLFIDLANIFEQENFWDYK